MQICWQQRDAGRVSLQSQSLLCIRRSWRCWHLFLWSSRPGMSLTVGWMPGMKNPIYTVCLCAGIRLRRPATKHKARLFILSRLSTFLPTEASTNCCLPRNTHRLLRVLQKPGLRIRPYLGMSAERRRRLHFSLSSSRAKNSETQTTAGLVPQDARQSFCK